MSDALARNHAIYEDLWPWFDLFPHAGWAAWREIAPFVAPAGATGVRPRVVEIGPGKFPHVPIEAAVFVDLSMNALRALGARGGACVRGADPIPLAGGAFDVVCLFEVLEHVDDDARLLDEVARLLSPGGHLFLSCPMNPAYWTYYDSVVGHERRYPAATLEARLAAAGFAIEKSCARHDRMDKWFGALFGFGLKRLPRLTTRLIKHYMPRVAAIDDPWSDGPSLAAAEKRGGVTLRARKL